MEHDSDYSEFVKQLIEAVRSRPCIYDKKHASYFNRLEREKAWFEIAGVLGQSVDDCQKRWKLLREKLAKELKKRDRILACGEVFQSDWKCFEKIVFIEDHIAPRKKLERYPYYFAPIDYNEKAMHPPSESNHSNGSHTYNSEQQQQSQIQQQHQEHDYMSHYHQSAKRRCQHNYERSSSTELSLARKSASLDDGQIKEEPSDMVEIDDLSEEPDMYEIDMMEKHTSKRAPMSEGNKIMHNDYVSQAQRKAEAGINLQPRRFEMEHNVKMSHSNAPRHNLAHKTEHLSMSNSSAQQHSLAISSAGLAKTTMPASNAEDADTLFGKMVTAMLRDIAFEEQKDYVKLGIMQMLIKAKRGHANGNN